MAQGLIGAQSEGGNTFVARILTVTARCRQQERHVLTFVADAVHAPLRRATSASARCHPLNGYPNGMLNPHLLARNGTISGSLAESVGVGLMVVDPWT